MEPSSHQAGTSTMSQPSTQITIWAQYSSHPSVATLYTKSMGSDVQAQPRSAIIHGDSGYCKARAGYLQVPASIRSQSRTMPLSAGILFQDRLLAKRHLPARTVLPSI